MADVYVCVHVCVCVCVVARQAVYNKLFDHLVHKINAAFDRDTSASPAFIGILDIFGFEVSWCLCIYIHRSTLSSLNR